LSRYHRLSSAKVLVYEFGAKQPLRYVYSPYSLILYATQSAAGECGSFDRALTAASASPKEL